MRISRLFAIALMAFIFGCSSDDDNDNAYIENGINRTANLQATGASAKDFLSAGKYQSVDIEVLYVQNFRPEAQTLENLKQFMINRLNKPGGITITERQIVSPGSAPFDINEVAAIESANRTKYNNGNILTLSLLFLDGGTTTDTDSSVILGTAYRNTSFVAYESSIRNFSNSLGEPSRVDLESTVLIHELGHLLGLVNLGSPMQTEHLDEAHDKHCDNPNCLMYWKTNSSNVLDMMVGGNVPQLDANCIADLQANGGK